jgi:UDP-N-acetylglucosamine 2-epimerase (non-hydrolysing)
MEKYKILIIFGTRPEAIKMAPVVQELEKHPRQFEVRICVTAQHRQLLDQVLNLFRIPVHHDLNVMEKNQNLFRLSSRLILKLQRILLRENPDLCLVQGDTTSAFLAALASFYCKIKTAHVEAGLRTNDKFRPFPEEINRHLLSTLADLHFAPTISAKNNLLKENVPKTRIFVTGNTVIDALYSVVRDNYEFDHKELRNIDFNKKIILVTLHRRESFGPPFENMCRALEQLKIENENVEIIYPVHLNPNVQRTVQKVLKHTPGIHLIQPLDYQNFVQILKRSYLVLTDSGGIQEEAPALGKPVLVLRQKTERPEAVKAGTARLVGTEKKNIIKQANRLLHNESEYQKMAQARNPFGDGKAAQRIVKIIFKFREKMDGSVHLTSHT